MGMSERTEALTLRAAYERQRLSDMFDSLEDEMSELTDWRTYVNRDPILALGVATVAGIIGGAMLSSGRRGARGTHRSLRTRNVSGIASLRAAARSVLPSRATEMIRKASPLVIEMMIASALARYAKQRKDRRTDSAAPAAGA
jgi:hypothetical protein